MKKLLMILLSLSAMTSVFAQSHGHGNDEQSKKLDGYDQSYQKPAWHDSKGENNRDWATADRGSRYASNREQYGQRERGNNDYGNYKTAVEGNDRGYGYEAPERSRVMENEHAMQGRMGRKQFQTYHEHENRYSNGRDNNW